MDTKAITLRALLVGMQLVCGCAHFEPAPMDPMYGVTPPGYVSQALREGMSMEVAVESPAPYKPSIGWSRAEPAEPVSATVADEPGYGISDMLAQGTVNLLHAFVGGSRRTRKEERHSTVVVRQTQIVHAAAPVQRAPQIVIHKVARVEHHQPKPAAQPRPKTAEYKPVHHKAPEHKPAQPKPTVNKSAPVKEHHKKK